MSREVLDLFAPVPSGVLVDATVGGGGHAVALLDARDDLDLVGFDRDGDAIAAARTRLQSWADRVTLRHTSFEHLTAELTALGHDSVSGVLFDLGVSSPQLDRPERGFSYRSEGPLDMRMDPSSRTTADTIVNTYAADRLADILQRNGDERFARRIARAIVAARPITSTTRLAEVVRDAIPAATRRTGGHPAKRTFQALRIEVNRELEMLPGAIDQAIDVLDDGGRCAVLAYHSGEDRIVKERFLAAAEGSVQVPAGFPVDVSDGSDLRLVTRGAVRPTAEEISRNPRAESARLRAVERRGSTDSGDGAEKVVVE